MRTKIVCPSCSEKFYDTLLKCPYCGTTNYQAQKYEWDMQDANANAYATTKKYASIAVRMIVIAILLIVIVVFGVIEAKSYSIKRVYLQGKAERKYEEYAEFMDKYLQDENYIAFYGFVEENYIDGYDSSYEKYIPEIRVCTQYAYLYEYIMRYYTQIRQEAPTEDVSRSIGYVAEQLNYFYHVLNIEDYEYYEHVDIEKSQIVLEGIENKVNALLQTYCSLTMEDVESLRELSDARRMVLLEDRMSYEE